MRLSGRQHRFVLGSLGGWIGVRVALVWIGGVAPLGLHGGGRARRPWPRAPIASAPVPTDAWSAPIGNVARRPLRRAEMDGSETARAPIAPALAAATQAVLPAAPPSLAVAVERAPSGSDVSAALGRPPVSRPAPSRWAGAASLFARPGSGRPSLAAGGTLGGSQAAARLAYQLNPTGPVRTAVAVRLYAPLAIRGAEAALGLDWHPLAGVPLRLSVERRFDLDGAGRSAWSAYAAGGFYREKRGGRLVFDGYGQAGMVGLARRDLFVDGAIRAGRRLAIGPGTATLGAGLWGAAQPGVARLDVGPRMGVSLPVAGDAVSVALDGRMRVAGRAGPGSGVALTIAVDLRP